MTVTIEQVQSAKSLEEVLELNRAVERASAAMLSALMAHTVSTAEANKASALANKVQREISRRVREFERGK